MSVATESSGSTYEEYSLEGSLDDPFDLGDGYAGDLYPQDELDEEEVTLSSSSLPLVKDIMKRVLKVSKLLKTSKQKVSDFSIVPSEPSGGDEASANNSYSVAEWEKEVALLKEYEQLYSFLWARLLRLLYDEQKKCADVYASTLNAEDRVPFESLAHAIHHNTVFCDAMGELIDFSYEQRGYDIDDTLSRQQLVLKEHLQTMERIQLTATNCAVIVVEGSRESFLDPVSMYDLCKTVSNEHNRRKRLVPLSLMFSTLEQDDQAMAEAFVQGIPRIILQRLRHLVHRIFGRPTEGKDNEVAEQHNKRSPQRYRCAVVRSEPNSHLSSRRASPQAATQENEQTSPLLLSTLTFQADGQQDLPDSPLPVLPGSSEGTFPAELPLLMPRVEHRKRSRQLTECTLTAKVKRFENGAGADEQQYAQLNVGDRVGRGPRWNHENQGNLCDYGEVVGFTECNQVLVKWIPSCDASTTHHGGKLYRYRYAAPHFEVVHWEDYLKVKTMNVDKDALRKLEFMLFCALAGSLCRQRDTILPALQFQTIESTLHVIDSVGMAASQHAAEHETELAEMREKQRLAAEEEDGAVDEDALASLLQWDFCLQRAKQKFREDREWVLGAIWTLSAVLSHRRLAFLFLEADGVRRILQIVNESAEIAVIYSCSVVLTHLSKTSVFEELLRRQRRYYDPIMNFVMHQWKRSPNTEVQTSAGEFLFHAMSFPCVLAYFDNADGSLHAIASLENDLTASEEHFDVLNPNVQLTTMKCMNTYLISHLMLATRVIFRKHRVLSTLVTKSSPNVSLPRDPATVDAVLGFLTVQSPALPDVSAENVQSLLILDRLPAIQKLIIRGFHKLLLRYANFYFIQSRWDLLSSSLQALCVLTVIPHVRPLVAEPQPLDSGIAQLLVIVNELSVSYNKNNTSREAHLLPCVVAALHILINVMTPPTDTSDEAAVATFNNICGIFRASDGVRTLLDALKVKRDVSMSAKLSYFPVVARAVQLMAILRRYGDTSMLFEALGVHRVAQDLLAQYGDVQREYISMMGSRKLHTELDPAGRFMENVKCFMSSAFGGEANQTEVIKVHTADPLEMEQRQAIISRAVIDYSKKSLLELVARHLEKEGLSESARTLRMEGNLDSHGVESHSSTPFSDPKSSSSGPTLNNVVRTYLRQQQERCVNPIETLPEFDLTKKHVYLPLTAPPDESRNVFNRLLQRKSGEKFSFRTQVKDNFLTYRYPAFMFDITGGGEGIQGESLAFCDDGDAIVVGTSEGEMAFFDTFPEEVSEKKLLETHPIFENESVASIVVSYDGSLLAGVSEGNVVKVMQRRSLPVIQQEFSGCRTIRFSHDNSWVLATCDEQHMCRLYDINTRQELRCFSDRSGSGENMDNIAIFDYSSQLVLNDAILWDVRCSDKPVFRFDRITESFASTFHPSNQLIIIDEKVWDLRSLRIVQTVSAFQKTSSFHVNRAGNAIYSFREGGTLSSATPAPIISAVDTYSMGVIFSEEVRPAFKTFAIDPSDRYCAAIVNQDMDTMIRVRLFNMSSGPFSGHGVFTSHDVQEESEGSLEDEDEDGDWSMDSGFGGDEYDNDDDDASSTEYNPTGDDEDDDEEEDVEDDEDDEESGEGTIGAEQEDDEDFEDEDDFEEDEEYNEDEEYDDDDLEEGEFSDGESSDSAYEGGSSQERASIHST